MHLLRGRIRRDTGESEHQLQKYGKVYTNLRRFLKKLESAGLLISERIDLVAGTGQNKPVWWRPTVKALDLIRQVQISNKCKQVPVEQTPARIPGVLGSESTEFATFFEKHAGKLFSALSEPTLDDYRNYVELVDMFVDGSCRVDSPRKQQHIIEKLDAFHAAWKESTEYQKWYRKNSWRLIPQKNNPMRVEAAKHMMTIRDTYDAAAGQRLFRRVEVNQDKDGKPLKILNPRLKKELGILKRHYEQYIDYIRDKSIILVSTDSHEDYLELPYRTRFNDTHKQLLNLDQYDTAWDEATKYYDKAVFLTLTTDPKMHPNLYHANRHMGVAWNRYTAFLSATYKRFERRALEKKGLSKEEIREEMDGKSYRPKYICVHEFQENGLIHSHIVIFGRSWLATKKQISEDWARCGQGQIVDIYGLTRTKNNDWQWTGKKPDDANSHESPQRYLRKYLQKAMHDHRGFEHYFTVNKKFWSRSQRFNPAPETEEETHQKIVNKVLIRIWKKEHPSHWTYGTCIPAGDVPEWMEYHIRRGHQKEAPIILHENVGLQNIPPDISWGKPPGMSLREYLHRKGLLAFKTAKDIFQKQKMEELFGEPPDPGDNTNPDTGKPYSIADYL